MVGLDQSNETQFPGWLQVFLKVIAKEELWDTVWKSAPLNKTVAKGITLKTDANIDALELIIIRARLEECFSEPTFLQQNK